MASGLPRPTSWSTTRTALWRKGPRKAYAAVAAELDGEAAAFEVTSMVPSITAVDRRGAPMLPGLLYGDARARDDAARPADPRTSGASGTRGRRMLEWADRRATGRPRVLAVPGGGHLCAVRGTGGGHRHRGLLRRPLRAEPVGPGGTRGARRRRGQAVAASSTWAGPRAPCPARRPSQEAGRSTRSASRSWPAPTGPGTSSPSSVPPSSSGWSARSGSRGRG